jgi:hypothetical protein
MKKQCLLLGLLLVSITLSLAQVRLEKTYNVPFMNRFQMPINGEFYFQSTTSAATFNLYGGDHNLLRQIPLVGKQSRKRSVGTVTETPNGKLRFLVTELDSLGIKNETYYLSDDSGHILLSHPAKTVGEGFVSISFLKTLGLPDRLLIKIHQPTRPLSTIKVFDLDGSNLNYITKDILYFDIRRINLDVSGEKFWGTNELDSVFLYNSDLTLWKKFKIPFRYILSISQNLINTDTLVELVSVIHYNQSNSAKLIAINELGQEVYSYFFSPYLTSISDNEQIAILHGNITCGLFTLKNGIHLVNFFPAGQLDWNQYRNFGKKYTLSPSEYSDSLTFYNENLSFWKKIKVPVFQYDPSYFSRFIYGIENSGLLHIAFAERHVISPSLTVTPFTLIDEQGKILLKIPDHTTFKVSQFNGLPSKLVITNVKESWTKVYGFNYPNATTDISQTFKADVFPNPFDNTLTLKLDAPNLSSTNMLTLQVIDITGKVLLSKTTAVAAEIPLLEATELAKGFYFLRINKGGKGETILKMVKQ